MKRDETQSKPAQSNRRYQYTKVLDNRKHPVRGLWKRNRAFVARQTVEDGNSLKKISWVALAASTTAEAQAELRKLLTQRDENALGQIGRTPKFGDYLEKTYLPSLPGSGKKPDTVTTEMAHYRRWREALGNLRVDKIRPSHIKAHLHELRTSRSARTCNLALVCLRHVLKAAKTDGYLKTLPTEDIGWQKTDKKSRRLNTLADIELICEAGLTASKNGGQFSDYLRLLAFSGARGLEALRLRWSDVDFERGILTIGAEGDTKNREARRVNFNPKLETHLEEMHGRRAPDSQWMFPSPQRGERDERSKTFRESLLLTRAVSGWLYQRQPRLQDSAPAPTRQTPIESRTPGQLTRIPAGFLVGRGRVRGRKSCESEQSPGVFAAVT